MHACVLSVLGLISFFFFKFASDLVVCMWPSSGDVSGTDAATVINAGAERGLLLGLDDFADEPSDLPTMENDIDEDVLIAGGYRRRESPTASSSDLFLLRPHTSPAEGGFVFEIFFLRQICTSVPCTLKDANI